MALRFDVSKPSHVVGAVAAVALAIFVVYELATSADVFTATLLKSLALGSVYAIIALAFVLIFKATEVINFAQGALAMIGALFISFMVADKNLPIIGFFWEVPNPIYELGGPTWIKWFLSVIVALVFAVTIVKLGEGARSGIATRRTWSAASPEPRGGV